MKQITMDYDLYESELQASNESGYRRALGDVIGLLRDAEGIISLMTHAKCSRVKAQWADISMALDTKVSTGQPSKP